jgi:hypothetical protein
VSDIKVTPPDGRERNGSEPAPRLPRRTSASRHGAIARELTKYSNYKSWAEKVRGSFAADPDATGVHGTVNPRRTVDR